jgi:hypothetical protein
MPFVDGPGQRALVRQKLRAYLAAPPHKGTIALASTINSHKATIATHVNKAGSPISHDTIDRFLNEDDGGRGPKVRRTNVDIIYRFLAQAGLIIDPALGFHSDPVFQVVEDFYSVKENDLQHCKWLLGTFSLFFRSEDLTDHVVVGAMRFSVEKGKDVFKIAELQERKDVPATERWSGYYFSRKDRFAAILRGEGPLEAIPKFYILHAPHSDKHKHIAEIGGVMLKIGTIRSVFWTKVLLRRDINAFRKCRVRPAGAFKASLLAEIT